MTELNENDCTAPRIYRKRTKPKKKTNTKQMTMYDYAASISYKNKQFYSSLDNTTTTKTITKAGKRPLTVKTIELYSELFDFFLIKEHKPSSSISKKSNVVIYKDLSPRPPPDFVDNLLQYLDERSRNMTDLQNN